MQGFVTGFSTPRQCLCVAVPAVTASSRPCSGPPTAILALESLSYRCIEQKRPPKALLWIPFWLLSDTVSTGESRNSLGEASPCHSPL